MCTNGGMPLGEDPFSFCSTAPIEALARLPPEVTWMPEWAPSWLVIDRIRAHLSMCPARRGNSSLIWIPETLVGMTP
jgi:hypothetical protein